MSLNGVIAANVEIARNEIEITRKTVGFMIKVVESVANLKSQNL